MFLPYINYCSEVWGNTYISNIKSIFVLQKKVVRIINYANFNDHTNELFLKSKIIKFLDLVKLKTAIVIYKANKHLLPINVQTLFDNKDNFKYNLRNKQNFVMKHTRTKLKSMCLSVVGLKYWNSLDINLTNAKSLNCFKKLYKKYIFNCYKLEV